MSDCIEMKITKKYLTFDVNDRLPEKKVLFREGGDLVLDLDVKLDNVSPDFKAYVDVGRFFGKVLKISCVQDMPLAVGTADEIGGEYGEPMRPDVHFTVKNGFSNDPNGLFYYGGTYHMFYQYNPCGKSWGNMHWGHAVSTDLLHWRELDVLLCPDEFGTVYSGSAFIDTENASGLKKGKDAPILLYYTAAGDKSVLSRGQPRTQRLAYSTDGGKTFEKYPGTILGSVTPHNRDPMVTRCDELGKYLMVLYLEKSDFGLFASDDLLRWEEFQTFTMPGEDECPCFRKLKVKGKDESKWVFIGCHNSYAVADFADGKFVFPEGAKRMNEASAGYAAQCFVGTENDEAVGIEWVRADIPESNLRTEMSVPYSLTLEKTDEGYVLLRQPHETLGKLAAAEERRENFDLTAPLKLRLDKSAADISLAMKYDGENRVDLCVFGRHITLDMKKNAVSAQKYSSPLSADRQNADVRVIADKCSVEVFADGGRYSFSAIPVMDPNLKYLEITAEKPVFGAKLTLRQLSGIRESLK